MPLGRVRHLDAQVKDGGWGDVTDIAEVEGILVVVAERGVGQDRRGNVPGVAGQGDRSRWEVIRDVVADEQCPRPKLRRCPLVGITEDA